MSSPARTAREARRRDEGGVKQASQRGIRIVAKPGVEGIGRRLGVAEHLLERRDQVDAPPRRRVLERLGLLGPAHAPEAVDGLGTVFGELVVALGKAGHARMAGGDTVFVHCTAMFPRVPRDPSATAPTARSLCAVLAAAFPALAAMTALLAATTFLTAVPVA